jgi:cobalamin biosynthesis protein CbiG
LKLEKELVALRTVVETYKINEEIIKKQLESVLQQSERSAKTTATGLRVWSKS